MEIFNLISGLVTIASLLFSLWIFMDSRKKEAVERERATLFFSRLADMLSMTNSIAKQANLIGVVTDRDETTKKEIKHLILAQLSTIESLQYNLNRLHTDKELWKFGVPSKYIEVISGSKVAKAKEAKGEE
jgi:hypothetical protein